MLSIIVPVYQVVSTLQRCVDSLLDQNIEEAEIILVDDGSTDGSSALCDALAAQYTQISVVHQDNAGLSAARNTGLQHTRGDIITFVDSDDTLAPNTYRPLLREFQDLPDCDLLEYSVAIEQGAKRLTSHLNLPRAVYDTPQQYWLQGQAWRHTYAWNKLYRRYLFDPSDQGDAVRFPVGKIFEDAITLPLLLKKARHIATTSTGTYRYAYNPQGISVNASGQDLSTLLETHVQTLQQWHDATYYAHLLNLQLDVYRLTHQPPILPSMPYANTPKLMIAKLIGIENLCKIHSKWKK